jgi:hypothetical protein
VTDNSPKMKRSHTWRRTTVVAVAAAVVFAALGGGWYLWEISQPNTSIRLVADGPTLDQALDAVNRSVESLPGGPWTLFGGWGIATPTPLAATVVSWPNPGSTANACGEQFNGLTLWNGSIPLFDGTFNSGTAPFWQFAFFSNTSQSIEIATDVNGTTRAFPPMLMTSSCAASSWLGDAPWLYAKALTPFPPNSSILGGAAWANGAESWVNQNAGAYETYYYGYPYWGSANLLGSVSKFSRCGLVGASGVQPVSYFVGGPNGTIVTAFTGMQGCGNVESLGPPPVFTPYNTALYSAGNSTFGETYQVSFGITLTYGDIPNDTDPGGLAAWMVGLNLTQSTGSSMPLGSPACGAWVAGLGDCEANATGWFAVLSNPAGGWLGSYGTTRGGAGWTVPNVGVFTNQTVTLVFPSSWTTSGLRLEMSSVAINVTLSGGINL